MLLIIDNYDSFTYNIVQTVAALLLNDKKDEEILVFRNDAISLDEIASLGPRRLLISPGPCTPKDAGISIAAIARFAGIIPILGVCLGHQSVNEAFGGKTVRAERLMHGKISSMRHDGRGVFTALPNPFDAMRYHSLVADEASLPPCLEPTCRSESGELMGLRHKTLTVEGVQFHPESIMTPAGVGLLRNFMDPAYPDIPRR